MKKYAFALLSLWIYTGVKAQLYVQTNATLHVGGVVTLHNEDFIRESPSGPAIGFEPSSNVLFTGNADNVVSGYISFLNLEIAKEGTHKVSLQNYNEEVRGQMVFTSGLFDLNNNSLLLSGAGTLVNENESSHIIGPSGGTVYTSLLLNQPNNVNPGNIGSAITSSQDLGTVTIQRGYVYASGLPPNAVQRYYTISFADPGKDANLDAALKLQYFDNELAGADETKLVPWKREDFGPAWEEQGPTANISRNTTDNWVQLTGIASLSSWTLAESLIPVPISLSAFNITCRDNGAVINWQTASESNTDHFEVERSSNGTDWVTIATQKAAGQSNTLQNYSYADGSPASSAKLLYRIKAVDKDSRESYSPAKVSGCKSMGVWTVWPNPATEQVRVSLSTEPGGAHQVRLQLIDSKGSVVRRWNKELQPGANQFTLDLHNLPGGAYHLTATWDEGRSQKVVKLLKQ